MVFACGKGGTNRWRSAALATIGLVVALSCVWGAAAQPLKNVPIPRLAPSDTQSRPADEGGPGEIDIPTGSGDALFADTPADDIPDVGPFDGLTSDPDSASPLLDGQPDVGPPSDIRPGTYTLEARMTADGPALADGVRWRIFDTTPGPDGKLPLLGDASGGVVFVRLDPGTYYIHAAYGHAGAGRRLEVTGPTGGAVVVLNAGGLRLLAINGADQPLSGTDVTFDVFAPDESGIDERNLVVSGVPAGRILGLTAGVYRVVCHYGSANAVVRADIRVDAGKLTEATLYQKAARLTLKLVETHGGEALADTAWSVLTPTGEEVISSVGAFPSVVLAAGEYRAIARHGGNVYESDFTVQAGVNRDVEVLLR